MFWFKEIHLVVCLLSWFALGVSCSGAQPPDATPPAPVCRRDHPDYYTDPCKDVRSADDLGSHWREIVAEIDPFWEKLRTIVQRKDRDAFANLVDYPATFVLVDVDSEMNFRKFEIRTKEEARRLFPYIFSAYVREGGLFDDSDVSYEAYPDELIRLFGDVWNLYLKVKKLPFSGSKPYPVFRLSFKKFDAFTWNIANDTGRIRYELRHARRQKLQGSPAQSGSRQP